MVFASAERSDVALLASTLHEAWPRKNSSPLETRVRYLPSGIYGTLPRTSAVSETLGNVGMRVANERAQWCRVNDGGLTDFYNALHDPARQDPQLALIRTLLSDIDRATCCLRME